MYSEINKPYLARRRRRKIWAFLTKKWSPGVVGGEGGCHRPPMRDGEERWGDLGWWTPMVFTAERDIGYTFLKSDATPFLLKRDIGLLHLRMSNFRRLVLHDYSLIS